MSARAVQSGVKRDFLTSGESGELRIRRFRPILWRGPRCGNRRNIRRRRCAGCTHTGDGVETATATSAAVAVVNSLPQAPGLELRPDPPEHGAPLTCVVAAGAVDADGDAITYEMSWAVDGAAWTASEDSGAADSGAAGTDSTWPGDTVPADVSLTAEGKHVVVIGGGDTGSDCIGTSNRQGAKSVTQLEILPRPPERDAATPAWPYWPMVFRTSSSHEEGVERDFAVSTKRFAGSNGPVSG